MTVESPSEEWGKYRRNYLGAYDTTLNAERHANEQVKANPSNRLAKDNVMFARLAGCLFLELHNRRAILSESPCVSLINRCLGNPATRTFMAWSSSWANGTAITCYDSVRKPTKKHPAPSSHPSRPSFDTLENMTRECMMADGKDYRAARREVRIFQTHCAFSAHSRSGSCARRLPMHAHRRVLPDIDPAKS